MEIQLDRIGLEILVKGSVPYYDVFNHPLLKKAGHSYRDQSGSTFWDSLKNLSEKELYQVYQICRKSWE